MLCWTSKLSRNFIASYEVCSLLYLSRTSQWDISYDKIEDQERVLRETLDDKRTQPERESPGMLDDETQYLHEENGISLLEQLADNGAAISETRNKHFSNKVGDGALFLFVVPSSV